MFQGAGSYVGGAQERMKELDFDPSKPMMQTGSPQEPSIAGMVNAASSMAQLPPQAAGMLSSGAEAADVIRGIYSFGKTAASAPSVLSGLSGGAKPMADKYATLSASQPGYKAANTAVSMAQGAPSFGGQQGELYSPQSSIRPQERAQYNQQRGSMDMQAVARGIPGAAMAMFGYGPR
jgi:hypothetical protein